MIGLRYTIMLAIIAGLLAAAAIPIAADEARCAITAPQARRTLRFNFRELWHAGLPRALIPVTLFELSNVATTMLIPARH